MNKTLAANNGSSRVKDILFHLYKARGGQIVAFAILLIILCVTSDNFLSVQNLTAISKQAAPIAILSLGMTILLSTGNIDLSCGAGVAVTACTVVTLIKSGWSFYAACLAGIGAGMCIGLVIGLVVAFTGIAAFIVTIGFQSILLGVAYFITGGQSVSVRCPELKVLSQGDILGVPNMVWVVAVVGLIVWFLFTRTVFGRNMFAVGGNPDAARYAGINLKKTTIVVYVIMGFLTAIAGILLAARMSGGQASLGSGYEGNAISSALIGGTAFTGGTGSVSGTLIGVCIVTLLDNGLNLLEVNAYWQYIAEGAIVLIAIYIDNVKKVRENRA